MAIPSSGEIKMGGSGTNSIAQVKAGTDTGTPSAVQNVSLRGLSVDGVTDFNYTGGANTDIAVAGSSPDQTAPHAMSEFHGYVQAAMGSFPAFSQGYTSAAMTGSTTSTSFNGYQTHFSNAFGIQVGAFAVVGFRHTPSNGYVTMEFYSGSNASAATTYYQKIPYTGLSNATWSVKYEYPNTSSAIPTYEQYANETTYDEAKHPATSNGGSRNEGTYYQLSTGGTGNSFFMQFPWIATAEYRNSPQTDNAQARVGTTPIDVQFTLKATQGGTDYTVTSSSIAIELHAQRGAFLP